MFRLLMLVILIGALYAADAFFFSGRYAAAVWGGFRSQVEVINAAAQNVTGMLHQ